MALRDSTLRRIALGVYAVCLLGLVASALMDISTGAGDPVFSLIVFTFPTVGVIVLNRRPGTTLGWVMLSMGLMFAVPFQSYGAYALADTDGSLPGGAAAIALGGPSWVPFIGISGYLLLLFPDGHLPSPRWRWFSWMCGIGLVLLSLAIVLFPGDLADSGFPDVTNPLGLAFLGRLGGSVFVLVAFAPLVVVGGAVAIIRRLRRASDPVERQQLRWLAWAAGLIAFLYVVAFIPQLVFGVTEDASWETSLGSIAALSFVLIPITIGMAILRYRLYEIDVVIRKTVVFAVLAVFIAVVYVALVAGIGIFVGTRTENVGVAAAAIAAAVVALAFQPVSRWARRLADRLVYGQRANPYEVLARFGDQLADTYAADDVLVRIARVLTEGIGADRTGVWLLVDDRLRQVAVWPADGADTSGDLSVEVRHQGELLGALSVAMPANDPMDPAKEKLVRDLAAQAGLVLRNVRLTEQLRARLEDLQAAQRRLVTAQDEERRKLERNIHDGAQQQLVALSVKMRLAQAMLERDPARADQMLAELQDDSQRALEDLRDLARGIYPPLLADKGLPAALEAQARKSPVPVTVRADVGRFPQDVEAAVYFSCLEALQNVSKYAHANDVQIEVRALDGRLHFQVRDDGAGFDPTATGYGTGLQGIADRLSALDGTILVTSAPGEGTSIDGSLRAGSVDARVLPGAGGPEPSSWSTPLRTTAARRDG